VLPGTQTGLHHLTPPPYKPRACVTCCSALPALTQGHLRQGHLWLLIRLSNRIIHHLEKMHHFHHKNNITMLWGN
jgi:hypothetical protein